MDYDCHIFFKNNIIIIISLLTQNTRIEDITLNKLIRAEQDTSNRHGKMISMVPHANVQSSLESLTLQI